MPAESARPFRPARLASWLIAAAAICLVAGLLLLVAGALLGDALSRSADPLELAPFRWQTLARHA